MVHLLEEKLVTLKGGVVTNDRILPLSRLLIRNPTSEVIRDIVANSIKKYAKRLDYEEFHTGVYALRQAYSSKKDSQGNTTLSTAYKQVELDILASLKEGGVQSQNPRAVAEKALILDNTFRGNKDAAELSAEYVNHFKTIFPQRSQSLPKGEAVDLLVRTYSRTYAGADSQSH